MHGVEKSRARAREARKMHFVPQGEYSRMRTTNFELMIQKGSRVVQMIITHKRFHIIYIVKRCVALAVELGIQREHIVNRVSSYFPKVGHSATETELKKI